jgi:hypothetical protein
MKEKINLWYAEKFSSSPIKISDEEIEFVIERNCTCDQCGGSIFEMYDYPNIDIDADELLCEMCYEEEYQTQCPCCENTVMNNDISDNYFVINQSGAEETGKQSGFYKVLAKPYYRSGFFGFEYLIEGAFEFIKTIGIHGAYDNDCQSCGEICKKCIEKYINSNAL